MHTLWWHYSLTLFLVSILEVTKRVGILPTEGIAGVCVGAAVDITNLGYQTMQDGRMMFAING
jgi:hypothetical protein